MQATLAERNRKKRARLVILLIPLALPMACVVFAANRFSQMRKRLAEFRAQTGDTVAAFIGDLAARATATGQVDSVHTVRLSPATPGLVENVSVRVGDLVKQGDALVQSRSTCESSY